MLFDLFFLPAVGGRNADGSLNTQQGDVGHYWSSTEVSSSFAYRHRLDAISSIPSSDNVTKNAGLSIRCVR